MKSSIITFLAFICCASGHGQAANSNSTTASVTDDVSANRSFVEQLHKARPYSRALLASSAVAEHVEWWAAGHRDRLPWAGSWTGKAGITEFFHALAAEMTYERFETKEIIAAGSDVVTVISANGHAKRTGRAFVSEIVRIYTFREGQLVRVRSYYDTSEYEHAIAPKEPNSEDSALPQGEAGPRLNKPDSGE